MLMRLLVLGAGRDPDAALYGTDKTGKMAVVLLTIGAPSLKKDKLTFTAYHLPISANPFLRGGVVDAVIVNTRAVSLSIF